MSSIFEIVEKILESETSDLKLLAEIAGVDPAIMYARANLDGVDLQRQNVEYLYELETRFKGAELTAKQRAEFLRHKKSDAATRLLSEKIASLRIERVKKFMSDTQREWFVSSAPNTALEELLRTALLDPLLKNMDKAAIDQCGPDYVGDSISILKTSGMLEIDRFSLLLFNLFGKLHCRKTTRTVALVNRIYSFAPEQRVASYMVAASFSQNLTFKWIDLADDGAGRFKRVFGYCQAGKVSSEVFEILLRGALDFSSALSLLKAIKFELAPDPRERVVYYILRLIKEGSDYYEIFDAEIHQSLKVTFLRHILAQGDVTLTKVALDWLGSIPGGVGGIALANAVLATDDFKQALTIVLNVLKKPQGLGSAQTKAMLDALMSIARTKNEQDKVITLKNRVIREGRL